MPRSAWRLALLSLPLLAGCHAPRQVLLLVTVDTLRADHIGAFGGPDGLTPQLDALARQSLVFERAYTPASCTLPAIGALLTSRYPEELGIENNMSALPDVETLPAWLGRRGWRSGGVVSNAVLRRSSRVDRGFEIFDDQMRQGEGVRAAPERVSPNTTRAALAVLDQLLARPGPVFLWVHYQDPHGPYKPPPGYRRRFLASEERAADGRRELALSGGTSGEGALPTYQFLADRRDVAFYRAGYKGEVAYADDGIGGLLQGLTKRGLREQCTIVFAADHGEGLGEHDYWFAHGQRLHDALVHVPLLIRLPGKPGGRRSDVASLLDLFPTLATVAGGPAPAGLRGRDLLATDAASRASTVYLSTLKTGPTPRHGLISRGYHYLVETGEPGRDEQVFRVGSEVLVSDPSAAAALGAELATIRSAIKRVVPATQRELAPDEREGLAALGYVDGR